MASSASTKAVPSAAMETPIEVTGAAAQQPQPASAYDRIEAARSSVEASRAVDDAHAALLLTTKCAPDRLTRPLAISAIVLV